MSTGSSAQRTKNIKAEWIDIHHILCKKIWKCGKWHGNYRRKLTFSYVPITCIDLHHLWPCKKYITEYHNEKNAKLKRKWPGLRKNSGTMDHVFNHQRIIWFRHSEISEYVSSNIPRRLTAWINRCCETLNDMNIPPQIIALLKSFYSHQQAVVRRETTTTGTFAVSKEARWRCLLLRSAPRTSFGINLLNKYFSGFCDSDC